MKTSFKTTSLAILLATSLLSCSKDDLTLSQAEPSPVSNPISATGNVEPQYDFYINVYTYIPCANYGNGEWVFIRGKGKLDPHSPGVKPYLATLSDFTVTGEKTGNIYFTIQNKVYHMNAENEFSITVYSNQGNSVEVKIRPEEQNTSGSKMYVGLIKITC